MCYNEYVKRGEKHQAVDPCHYRPLKFAEMWSNRVEKSFSNPLTNRTLYAIMCIQGKGAVKLIEKATDTKAEYGKGETEIFLK